MGKFNPVAAKRQNRSPRPSAAQPTRAKSNYSGVASTNPNRAIPAGKKGDHFRSKGTIKRLKMYTEKPDLAAMSKQPTQPARINPDRRWFGNTRVITQNKLELFREEMSKAQNDPYSVVLKRTKLPMSLLTDSTKQSQIKLLTVESFKETFGSKKTRKRPKLPASDMSSYMEKVSKSNDGYTLADDTNIKKEDDGSHAYQADTVFGAGTSRRIYKELYKVIDSSDVIIMVLDARDPMGTRCMFLEKQIRKDHPHKHIVLLMNKVDLVPTWATKRWVRVLSKEYPTLAFHSSLTHPFGKQALTNLLRQFAQLHKDRKHLSVGFIGYPNVGKSSVINTLKAKKVCNAAPVPGETKVWQYVNLTNKIFLIDCPGVVPSDPAVIDESSKVLKGVVRAEKIESPADYIGEALQRVKKPYILKKYGLPESTTWTDGEDFLCILAKKMGKLLKAGEPDYQTAARIVIYDWQRGRIPYFEAPPMTAAEKKEAEASDEPKIKVKQSFKELACSMEYEEDDKKGDGDDDADEGEEETVVPYDDEKEADEEDTTAKRSLAKGKGKRKREETEAPLPFRGKKAKKGKGSDATASAPAAEEPSAASASSSSAADMEAQQAKSRKAKGIKGGAGNNAGISRKNRDGTKVKSLQGRADFSTALPPGANVGVSTDMLFAEFAS